MISKLKNDLIQRLCSNNTVFPVKIQLLRTSSQTGSSEFSLSLNSIVAIDMDSSNRFVVLVMVLSLFVGYKRVNGRLFLQPASLFFNQDPVVEEEEIVELAPVDQPSEPIQPPSEPNEGSDIEEVPVSPVTMSSTTTNGTSDDEEEVQSTTGKTTKNPSKKPREKSVSANEMFSERGKGIVIIVVILSVFTVCLVVCALCVCSTSKADDVQKGDLTVLPPLPQPESGWTSIRSESRNEATTRVYSQM